ncbi:antileukoproteinase [Glossophaga mutica]
MKVTIPMAFLVLLALEAPVSWAVEGASKEKAKQGDCPFSRPAFCLVYEPPRCRNDWQCPQKQKCCPYPCGIKCLDPVDPSQPVKVNPGKCPVVTGQCKMLSPRDHCLNDSHCPSSLKCCKRVCGNSCVKPV